MVLWTECITNSKKPRNKSQEKTTVDYRLLREINGDNDNQQSFPHFLSILVAMLRVSHSQTCVFTPYYAFESLG
jgi:hypothetical protein